MKTIISRFVTVIVSIFILATLWEFWLEDIILKAAEYHEPENLHERLEYIISLTFFTLLSLIVPFRMAIKDMKKRKKLEKERESVIAELQKALDEVKTLRGFLPICSHCKSIRDENGFWKQIEEYILNHSEAELTHSLCEQCAKIHYPEYFESSE